MILTRRALLILGWLAPFALWPALAQVATKKVADYQIGDTALSNIVATVELVVIDREASAALRQKEALKVPAIVRFDPNAGDTAIRKLREAFALTRDQFVVEMAAKFGGRTLTAEQINSTEFREFRTAFQNSNKGFPVPPKLAGEWAAGGTGGEVEQQCIARLTETLGQRLRPDEWPLEVRDGPPQVRVIEAVSGTALPALDAVEKAGALAGRQTFLAAGKARSELQKRQQPAPERTYGAFLATLVEANCAVEVELTRQLRAKKTEGLWSADRYAAGQMIVPAGEPVTHKVKAALDELAAQTAVTELRQAPWQPVKYWPLLVISISTGLVIAGVIVFLLSRRLEPRMDAILVQTSSRLPAGEPRALLGDAGPAPATAATGAAAREAGRPHLENALKDRLVNELLAQRKDLIDAQRQAAADLSTMEARLEQLHAPLQARLDAYERRIAELERDLATRGDENKELISATINLMKQKLASEKSGGRLTFN